MERRVSCPSCEKKYASVVGGEAGDGRLPVILPCLCVFCKECALAEEAKAQQQQGKEKEKGDRRIIKKRKLEVKKEYTPTPCMKCQKPSTVPVNEFKLDAALMRQIDSSGSSRSAKRKKAPTCDMCEEDDATKYCNDCARTSCSATAALLLRTSLSKRRAIIPLQSKCTSLQSQHHTQQVVVEEKNQQCAAYIQMKRSNTFATTATSLSAVLALSNTTTATR